MSRNGDTRALVHSTEVALRRIPSSAHGALDYAYSAALALAPRWFPHGRSRTRMLAAAVVAYSLLTNYEFGLLRVIPFEVHLLFDVILGSLLAGSQWLFDFAARDSGARTTLLVFGVIAIVVPLLSERHSATAY